nr:twin-arginine translocase subunit TatC [Nocardioides convexus]
MPGLHRQEKKWTLVFAVIAGPLFIIGIVLGYLTLPKGLEILIGFTQADLTNLVEFNDYLSFFIRTLLGFGIAFEIPVFVVLLNLAGIVKGKSLGAHRPWMIVGTFIFAAVMTPSGDPFTMSLHGRSDGAAVPRLRGDRPLQRPASRQPVRQRRPVARRGESARPVSRG